MSTRVPLTRHAPSRTTSTAAPMRPRPPSDRVVPRLAEATVARDHGSAKGIQGWEDTEVQQSRRSVHGALVEVHKLVDGCVPTRPRVRVWRED